MGCRADATGRILHRPACPESAFGSALLAGAGVGDGDVWKGVRARVRIERTFAPDPARAGRYGAGFERFRGELVKRGYL